MQMNACQCVSMSSTCIPDAFRYYRMALDVQKQELRMIAEHHMIDWNLAIGALNYGTVSIATNSKLSSLALIFIVLSYLPIILPLSLLYLVNTSNNSKNVECKARKG